MSDEYSVIMRVCRGKRQYRIVEVRAFKDEILLLELKPGWEDLPRLSFRGKKVQIGKSLHHFITVVRHDLVLLMEVSRWAICHILNNLVQKHGFVPTAGLVIMINKALQGISILPGDIKNV